MRDSDGKALLTRRALADAAGVSVRQVRTLQESGKLRAVRGVDGSWRFDGAAIELVRASTRPSSRRLRRKGTCLDARITARIRYGESCDAIVVAEGCNFERVHAVHRACGSAIVDVDERRAVELELELVGELVDWSKGTLLRAVRSLAEQHRLLRRSRVLAQRGELDALCALLG